MYRKRSPRWLDWLALVALVLLLLVLLVGCVSAALGHPLAGHVR